METFEHLLYQLHLSYLQARKNKRNTLNQLAFELNQETNLHNTFKGRYSDVSYKLCRSNRSNKYAVTSLSFCSSCARDSIMYSSKCNTPLMQLNETTCTIDNDLAKQLETYWAMKKGNIAPDIIFVGDHLAPGYAPTEVPQKLSDIRSSYTLVVFGASWCPKCAEELPEIIQNYNNWKKRGVEVTYISLDEHQETPNKFAKPFPFMSMYDYKKWDSDIVKDYFVFATPTMYLLDNQRTILLRPNSVKQVDAWVDWYLVQGNK